MKAVVTGGTGFVGSHIVRALIADGHSVRVVHRPTSPMAALAGVAYESAIGDITDATSLEAAFAGCDWVFHVAAVADYWRADTARLFHVNVEGTKAVLAAARAVGVQRVIFTSSAAAIGLRADGMPVDETHTFNLSPKQFPYAYSKVLAEQAVAQAVMDGQDVVILNPSIVLGPADLNVISGSYIVEIARWSWLTPCTSGGAGFVDVRDVARWHLVAAKQGRTGERYILSTANYLHRTIYDLVARVAGVPRPLFNMPSALLPLIAGLADALTQIGVKLPVDANQVRLGARFVYFDARKTHQELGPPRFTIPQSITDAYAWYRDNGYIPQTPLTRGLAWVGRQLLRR